MPLESLGCIVRRRPNALGQNPISLTGEARPSNDAAEFIAPLPTAFIKLEKPAVILALTFAKTGSIAFVTLAY
jgi:hypothetical protein